MISLPLLTSDDIPISLSEEQPNDPDKQPEAVVENYDPPYWPPIVKSILELKPEEQLKACFIEIKRREDEKNTIQEAYDQRCAVLHNVGQQVLKYEHNLAGIGYDLRSLVEVLNERFPLTGRQQEIVNKSREQQQQNV